MMTYAMRINYGYSNKGSRVDKESNIDATEFFDLLKDFDDPL